MSTVRGVLGATAAGVLSVCALAAVAARELPLRLAPAFPTPEVAATAVLDALSSRNSERLSALAVSEREFAAIVWPELPASRPERNLPLIYMWRDLAQKSRAGLARTMSRYGGVRYELLRVDFDGERTHYPSFTLHRRGTLTVVDGAGQELQLRLFGSMIEQGGKYKIYSYIVD